MPGQRGDKGGRAAVNWSQLVRVKDSAIGTSSQKGRRQASAPQDRDVPAPDFNSGEDDDA